MALWQIDRFISLWITRPLRRLFPRRARRIPILMYHSISDAAGFVTHPYYRTATSPRVFAKQMALLYQAGYRTTTLSAAVEQLRQGKGKPRKTVVLTFDDGFEDFYTTAYPVLNQYGFSASVFLPTAFVADAPLTFQGMGRLTWPQVRELSTVGISFGSHTETHAHLAAISPDRMTQEIFRSKQTIEARLGVQADSFAYPYAFPETLGAFKRRLCRTLADAGYKTGVSTVIGSASASHNPLLLPRLPINSYDDSELFCAKLEGAYDWLHWPQYLSKYVGARRADKDLVARDAEVVAD